MLNVKKITPLRLSNYGELHRLVRHCIQNLGELKQFSGKISFFWFCLIRKYLHSKSMWIKEVFRYNVFHLEIFTC